jgi:hypothetical protein
MGKPAVCPDILGRRQPKRSDEIDIGEAVGDGADEQGFFTQLSAGHDLADGGAQYDMRKRIHVSQYRLVNPRIVAASV